jgi:hypothetical protein
VKLFPDDMGPIAPAEAVLASIGMRPVVTRVVEPISPEQWRRARDMQFEVNKAAHALMAGNLPEPADSHDRPGYMRLLRDLARPYDPQQVKAMLDELPPELEAAAVPFTMLAAKAFQYLASQLPRQFISSISSGAQPVKPPDRLLDRFDSFFDILDDPVEALNRAATGQLLRSQVAALKEIFPSLLDYMSKAVAKEVVLARGQDSDFDLPHAVEIGIGTLTGVDVNTPALRQLLATPPVPAQDGAPKGKPPTDSKTPQQFMTRVQRTDANAP